MGKRIVIIGGVAAGPKAASRVKRVMPEAEVTLIDQDNLISYGGCGIPYYVSGDVSDESELRSTSFHMLRDSYFFTQAKGVKTLTSTRGHDGDPIPYILYDSRGVKNPSGLAYSEANAALGPHLEEGYRLPEKVFDL